MRQQFNKGVRKVPELKYPSPKYSDCQRLTDEFFDKPIDMERLINDAKAAEKTHEYTQKDFAGWTSLPLRSLHGMTGKHASDASGDHKSSDETKFQDTPAMQPYISEIINHVVGEKGGLLKVRLMKMKAKTQIGEHRDSFAGDGTVVRFHIPVITDPRVIFRVNNIPYYMAPGQLYRMDVLQRHAVVNASDIDRIHLVFDVRVSAAILSKLSPTVEKSD